MNCKKIQDKILTDYLDGEMLKSERLYVEAHIKSCLKCKEFLSLVKETAIIPLESAKQDHFSEDVIWSKIQQEIQEEKEVVDIDDNKVSFFEVVKDIVFFPKPAFALGSFVMILLLVMTLSFNKGQRQLVQKGQNQNIISIQDQVSEIAIDTFGHEEHLAYLFDGNDGYKEYGTSLEQYFL